MRYAVSFFASIWLPVLISFFLFSFQLRYDIVGITFLINIFVEIFFLLYIFSKVRAIALVVVYYVFTLFFFTVIPWVHYSESVLIWRHHPLEENTFLATNSIIFFTNLLIFAIFLVRPVNSCVQKYTSPKKVHKRFVSVVLFVLSIFSFLFLFYLNEFSLVQLLFRGLVDEARVSVVQSSFLSLFFGMTSRLIPVFCFIFAVTQVKKSLFIKFCLLVIAVFAVFPTGVPRYLVAFVYIPILLIFLPKFRNASFFSALLLGSLLFIFPFLDQFRYFSGFGGLRFLPTTQFFYAGHFDAYENFASVIENEFITFGAQLMGVFFFFVPRILWEDKPVGSGYEMAERMGYSFNNISMPFLAEGYVNFGVLGIFAFALLLGYLMVKLDGIFSYHANKVSEADYFLAVYYFVIGALFFVLRGDLLSSIAYITAGLVVAYFVYKLVMAANKFGNFTP